MQSSSPLVQREVVFAGKQVSVLSNNCDGPKQFQIETCQARSRQQKQRAFFICDIGRLVHQYRHWSSQLPNVHPFYGIKSNNDPVVMGIMARLGAGFDCASKREIEQALTFLDPTEAGDRIIFANPFKKASHIRYAAEHGVNMMTFDNEDELHKIKINHPNARAVIRIKPTDYATAENRNKMNKKFGIAVCQAPVLLEAASRLGVKVIGVSFHFGRRLVYTSAYADTIRAAAGLFDLAAERFNFRFELLDIGGGFCGDTQPSVSLNSMADDLRSVIHESFSGRSDAASLRVIAEPGRFFSMSAFTLSTSVIATAPFGGDVDDGKNAEGSSTSCGYILSDGILGSLAYTYLHMKIIPKVIPTAGSSDEWSSEEDCPSTLWGPTLAGFDCIVENCQLPKLQIGDWVSFGDVGAYTMVTAAEFNGMPKAKCLYVIEEEYETILG